MYIQYDQMSPAAQAAVRAWKPVDASGAVGDVSQRTWSLLHSLVGDVWERVQPLQPINWTHTKLDVSTSPHTNPKYQSPSLII